MLISTLYKVDAFNINIVNACHTFKERVSNFGMNLVLSKLFYFLFFQKLLINLLKKKSYAKTLYYAITSANCKCHSNQGHSILEKGQP